MIEGYGLALLLLAIAAALGVAELVLPTHGVLGVLGIVAALVAIVVALRQNAWAGLGLTVALALATPFIWTAVIKIWPRTPMGRRMILPRIESAQPGPLVRVGQQGVAVSELRPMGLCEFDGTRVEATSEHGIVESGKTVTVVALVDNRPVVRVA